MQDYFFEKLPSVVSHFFLTMASFLKIPFAIVKKQLFPGNKNNILKFVWPV